jgi:CubicO group peptidase (beta-lactamase class C family)
MPSAWVARHGLSDSQYQDEFEEHASDGLRPTVAEGYSVGGRAYYAAIWEDVSGPAWVARHGLSGSAYQEQFDDLVNRGYRLRHVSGYGIDDEARFVAIWDRRDGPDWLASHGLSAAEYQAEFETRAAEGYRLTHVSGYEIGGESRFAAIWEDLEGPDWAGRHDMTAAEYQREFDRFVDAGYQLTHVDGYEVDGDDRYAAIFEECLDDTNRNWVARHGLSGSDYQEAFEEWVGRGYRPYHVSGYSDGGEQNYAAIWRKTGFDRDALALIDRWVSSYMRCRRVPGLSLAITKDERLVFAKGYGQADREAGENVCPTHRFRIASISKPITAVAVMELVERGRLGLDDPVFGTDGVLGTRYGTPTYADSISADEPTRVTVKHLLAHESGWENHGGDPMFMLPGRDQDELIHWVLDNRPLRSEPGTEYSYLNFGYCLLGRVIEAVTDRTYESFVEDAVLAPCGIEGMTIAGNTRAERRPNEVVYYDRGAYGMDVERMDAHGGWIASPTELLKFLTRVDGFDRRTDILRPHTEQEAFDREGANYGYGEGWMLRDDWRGHNGAFSGAIGFLVRRDDGISFAALANTRPKRDQHAFELKGTVSEIVRRVDDWPGYDLW